MNIYKSLKITCLAFTVFVMSSCLDILDTTSRNMLADDTVWGSHDAIIAYIAKMYDNMQTEDLAYSSHYDEATFPLQVTDEAVRSYTWGRANDAIIPDNMFPWWGYAEMRIANSFIEKIANAPVSEVLKERYKAEARFIRAYHYFAMVKRYGGVPIIDKPQVYDGNNIPDLQVPRNKEQEVYDFIRTELDDIIKSGFMLEAWDASNQYRATKFAALALKSRAMLYAASIATYGQVQLDGVVGIPASEKDFYWREAMDAASQIINSGKYDLYGKDNTDKVSAFQNLFLTRSLHTEAIFTKAFSAPDRAHSFDFYNAAQSFKIDYGCVTNPTLELVEEYDYVDGTDGTLKINDVNGDPIKYADPYDLFRDKDPRLLASVLVPFAPWQNDVLEIRRGIILPDGTRVTAGNLNDTYGTGANILPIVGKDGPLDTADPTKTGFYIKKFMHPADKVNQNRSDTYWMLFRYAEVLLNYAEAAVELNQDMDNALKYINDLRKRAGVKLYDAIDLAKVRKERKLELAFENHRWWDIIRWRTAASILDNKQFKALHPYLLWEEGKRPAEMSYIFEIANAPKNPRTFLPKLYYNNIAGDQIRTNPKIVQNPGY